MSPYQDRVSHLELVRYGQVPSLIGVLQLVPRLVSQKFEGFESGKERLIVRCVLSKANSRATEFYGAPACRRRQGSEERKVQGSNS